MSTWRWKTVWLCFLLAAFVSPVSGATIEFDDPLAPQQWYHEQMNFPEAWARIYNQERRGDITVAVLDSGFQTNHPDLGGNLRPGINIVDGSRNIAPVHPHGTATGGIPGAQSGNSSGISQSAWTADILPIRISNRSDGAAYLNDIANGIRYAADQGARVINLSYGGVESREVAKAARYAWRHGAIVFMAAGNSGFETKWANRRSIVAVGSVDQNNDHSWFSTSGRFVDFVAPGEGITTLYTESNYAEWNGTSFSAPIAASVAALVLTANPELSPSQVLRILKKTAIDVSEPYQSHSENRKEFGYGMPDADAAVALALETRGRLASSYRRKGIDPYVESDWSALWASISEAQDVLSFIPSATEDPLGDAAIVFPQGFSTLIAAHATAAPEPATGVLLVGLVIGGCLRRNNRV